MRWLALVGGLLVAGALGWWVWQVAGLGPGERGEASGYGQFVLASIGLLIAIAGPVKRAVLPPPSRDHLLRTGPPIVVTTHYILGECLYSVEDRRWVAVGTGKIQVLVEAVADRAVIIREFRVRVERRTDPPAVESFAGRGGAQRSILPCLLSVDLGEVEPSFRDRPEVSSFPCTVDPSDPGNFLLFTSVARKDVSWRLEVHWLCGGVAGVVLADNRGAPFRIVEFEGRPDTDSWPF